MLKKTASLVVACVQIGLLAPCASASRETSKPLDRLSAPRRPLIQPLIVIATSTEHTVSHGETLWGISRKYGVSFDALVKLNGLNPTDPTINIGQTLRLPSVKKSNKPVSYSSHKVSKGETLFSIARRHGTTVTALMKANAMANPDSLSVGQSIKIPQSNSSSAPVEQPTQPANKPAPAESAPPAPTPAARTNPSGIRPPSDRANLAPDGYGIYTVQPDDTTDSIAAHYGISKAEFLRINQKSSYPNYSPRPGEFLMVPTDGSWYVPPTQRAVQSVTRAPAQSPLAQPLTPTNTRKTMLVLHEVRANDSLENLAKRFNTTTDQIRLDNPGIQKNSDLQITQILKIRTKSPL